MKGCEKVLKKNSYHNVEFIDLTHDAMGVAKINGFPVFVKDALKGEQAQIKITKVNKNFAFGRLIELTTPSPFRKKPICEHFFTCGGCDIMHMNYDMQLSFKKHRVKETLRKIGHITTNVNDMVGMNNPYYYRNKAIIPFAMEEDRLVAGLYKRRSHEIIDLKRCHIFPKVYSEIIKLIKSLLINYKISIYDEHTHKGLFRGVMIRHSEQTGDILLTLILNGSKILKKENIIEALNERYPMIKGIVINNNTSKGNVMLANKSKTIYGEDLLEDTLCGLTYKYTHQSFFQVNPVQTEALYQKALKYAKLEADFRVMDAYCGVGAIGLSAAKDVKEVIGFDVIKNNIKQARENAKSNNVSNVHFYQASDDTVLNDEKYDNIDVLFIDPPRKGCDKSFLKRVANKNIKRIIYISCNVSTFSRDANYLQKLGYKIKEVTPFDMFPQTAHIETVALIENN